MACKIRSVSLKLATHAPVAQLDRVPGYELGGREFESLRARHISNPPLVGFLLGVSGALVRNP